MALSGNNNVKAADPGIIKVYVDNINIADIDFISGTNYITITSTGFENGYSSIYQVTSGTIIGMKIAEGSNPTYVDTIVYVGESIGRRENDTYSASTVSNTYDLYLTLIYTSTGPRTIFLSITNGTVTEFSHELTPDTGYVLPSSVTVTGASSTYSGGVVTLTNLTSSVSETAEASPGGSGSLTVTYNSSDIIDTTSDGAYTLPCSGKIMNSDIVISAENVTSLTVTYNNTNIINASNDTHTYTLSCNGKYMNSDIGISVVV